MYVYAFVDSREVDRYDKFELFKNLEDAEAMRKSMKEDAKYFDVHKVKVIE